MEDYSLDPYLSKRGKTFEASTVSIVDEVNKDRKKSPLEILNQVLENAHFQFNPEDGLLGKGGETRMNKNTFDFIVKNELYNLDGQFKFRQAYLSQPEGARKALSFDKESIEVKGMWKQFSKEDLDKGQDKKFYLAIDEKGQKFGLTSLHIITKDVPNWFWCSFRQKDGPKPQVPSFDDYGQPKELSGTIWANYELSGTQTSFTDSRGKSTLLSDPYIEDGFQQSSCISCHSTSTVGPGALTGKDTLGFLRAIVMGKEAAGEVRGSPKETWFNDKYGKEEMVQLDFVYSLRFRARKKK